MEPDEVDAIPEDLQGLGMERWPIRAREAFMVYVDTALPGQRRSLAKTAAATGAPIGTVNYWAHTYSWGQLTRIRDGAVTHTATQSALSKAAMMRPEVIDFYASVMRNDREATNNRLTAAGALARLTGLEATVQVLSTRAALGDTNAMMGNDQQGGEGGHPSPASRSLDPHVLAAAGDTATLLALIRGDPLPDRG
jgi:hypothetical protein